MRSLLTTRQATVVELCGRAATVILVAFATTRVQENHHYVGWTLTVAGIWLLGLQMGFATAANELSALGPSLAVTRGVIIGLVGVTSLSAWTHRIPFDGPRLAAAAAAMFVLTLSWEVVVNRLEERPKVLIVGAGRAGLEIARELKATARAQFTLLGFVRDRSDDEQETGSLVLGESSELAQILTAEHPAIVVLAVERDRPAVFETLLDNAHLGFRVVEAAQFSEHAFGRVPVRDIQRAWFMSVLHLYQRPYSRISKRIFDILSAAALLIVSLPFLPFLALGVMLSRGPLIVTQTRIGEFGQQFQMYKFRTMVANAEQPGQPVWAKRGDPRVTGVGRVLRRLRLDELPQIWNVLRGDMSIVGPRPERPEFVQFLEQRMPFWSHRHLVKPGITGWAQVRRGYTSDAEGSIDKLSYDLWYLRHRSITVDLAICLQTLGVLVRGTPEPRDPRTSTAPHPVDHPVLVAAAPSADPLPLAAESQSPPATAS